MNLILTNTQACGNMVTIRRPAIGDEALSLARAYYLDAAAEQTTEEAVAVHAGGVIAIYWHVQWAGLRHWPRSPSTNAMLARWPAGSAGWTTSAEQNGGSAGAQRWRRQQDQVILVVKTHASDRGDRRQRVDRRSALGLTE